MIYLLILMSIQIVFLLIRSRKSPQGMSFAILLSSYLLLIMAILLFMSKNEHYTTKVLFFPAFPLSLWKWLFFSNISQNMVVRLFNYASILAIFCSLLFTYISLRNTHRKWLERAKVPIVVYLLAQLVIYDPILQKTVYYAVYPDLLSRPQYDAIVGVLEFTTTFLNLGLLLVSALLVCVHYMRTEKIKILQFHSRFVSICYVLLCLLYSGYFYIAPSYFLVLSKVADTARYCSISLFKSEKFYINFPIFLLLVTLLLTVNIYRMTIISRKIQTHNFSVSRQISASETTSKLFCHYIKNEILALQTQIELIPADADSRASLDSAIARCDHLYKRIDEIHHTTKTNMIHLKEEPLQPFLTKLMQQFTGDLHGYQVTYKLPDRPIHALIDQNHLGDAIHNIIRNAIDAMDPLPASRKTLTIKLQQVDNWVVISISDTANGIDPARVHDIFTPFFTTSTYKKHWGVGLTLTYKVIKAHDGEIEVDSIVDKGSTFRVLLPALPTALSNKSNDKKTKKPQF